MAIQRTGGGYGGSTSDKKQVSNFKKQYNVTSKGKPSIEEIGGGGAGAIAGRKAYKAAQSKKAAASKKTSRSTGRRG
jgi:hypothetical protein